MQSLKKTFFNRALLICVLHKKTRRDKKKASRVLQRQFSGLKKDQNCGYRYEIQFCSWSATTFWLWSISASLITTWRATSAVTATRSWWRSTSAVTGSRSGSGSTPTIARSGTIPTLSASISQVPIGTARIYRDLEISSIISATIESIWRVFRISLVKKPNFM